MKRTGSPEERGAALLLALATLALALSACAALARCAATVAARRNAERWTEMADSLSEAAEAAVEAWLAERSATVTLPPDCETPEVALFHDRFELDGVLFRVRATAWDQCGMVPLRLARAGSPLRGVLPAEMLAGVDRSAAGAAGAAGLDELERPEGLPSPFPEPSFAPPVRFGRTPPDARAGGPEPRPAAPAPALPAPALPAIGALLATHEHEGPSINVNTAPLPLLETALRAAGVGGIEGIVEARARGLRARVGALGGGAGREGDARAPLDLVARSDAWAVRIDVDVACVRRSWWVVYTRASS